MSREAHSVTATAGVTFGVTSILELALPVKMWTARNKEVCVRDLMTAFIAAIIVALLSVSAYGESAATSAGPPSPGNPSQLFDPTRGVLLQGAQGQEVAEMCGASAKSKSWEVLHRSSVCCPL
jgi:hypothetical protein